MTATQSTETSPLRSPASAHPAAPAAVAAFRTNAMLTRDIVALAAPTSLLALMQVAAQLFETWLASRQGTHALAGWAVMLPFVLLMQQMSGGAMGGGVVSAVARALGAKREDEASALVIHAVIIAGVAGLGFAVGVSLLARPMLIAVSGPDAAEAAAPYAWLLFGLGAVPMWMSNTLASVLRGGGRHALAARTLSMMTVGSPILAWVLSGPAGMGLAGLGASFAIVSWTAAGLMAFVVWRGGAGFVPTLRVRPTRTLFWRILSVGMVACCLAAVANLTTIIVTAQLRGLGPTAVAGYGVAARLEFLILSLAFGIGSALTALVGRAVGAGDWATARRTAWLGGGLAFTITGIIGIVLWLNAPAVARVFTSEPQVAAIAARALNYTTLAFGGFGLGMAMYFASLGAGRLAGPIVGACGRIGFAVGGGWVFSHVFGMGVDGYFLGVALGITSYGLFTAASVRPGVWRARDR